MMASPGPRALELLALGAQLGDDLVDALLLHRAHAGRAQAQRDPALLGLEPETLSVQIRQEAAALLVVGVRDSVTDGGPLAGDLADAGHTTTLTISVSCGSQKPLRGFPGWALYQPGKPTTRRGVGARSLVQRPAAA